MNALPGIRLSRHRRSDAGFLLIEVLLAALILSVAFVALLATLAQAVRVASASTRSMKAANAYSELWLDLETGLRMDLAAYGGNACVGPDLCGRVDSRPDDANHAWVSLRLSETKKQPWMTIEASVLTAPVS